MSIDEFLQTKLEIICIENDIDDIEHDRLLVGDGTGDYEVEKKRVTDELRLKVQQLEEKIKEYK